MKIHTGTSGFAYKEWKGTFYPEKISPKELLRSYSSRLSTVEINNTFYHMPNGTVLTAWADQVGSDFVFALKAPQVITHMKRLRHVSSETGYLFKSLSVLEKKLGPVLFQFPNTFHADPAVLKEFLALLRPKTLCAFEFRNASWLDDGTLDLLREKNCSLCIADADDARAGEIISTATWGYLRLRRSDYTDAVLSQWADKVLAQNWERAFVFFKHEGEGAQGPLQAMRFQELVDARGTELKKAG
ncbi:MAG: DUF72 domain-containing protein [Nitrospirota bacterium]